MKMRYLFLLSMLLAYSYTISANTFTLNTSEPEKGEKISYEYSQLEGWLSAQVLPGGMMMVYFNISQQEFDEYVNMNQINSLTIELFKRSSFGDLIQELGIYSIDNLPGGFDVESWTYQLENVDMKNWNYEGQVTINNDACGPKVQIPIVTDEPLEEQSDPPVSLPDYNCGDTYVYQNNTNTTPLAEAEEGEFFTIGGIPILLTDVSGGNGVFSGSGMVPVPFGELMAFVEFNNVSVNNQREVYEGSMTAVSDSPANYPDFILNPGVNTSSQDICLPPPPPPGQDSDGVDQVTGLNQYGFDPETGLHSETEGPYDENGFDVNGNHQSTGTQYNDQNCNRDGIDINGQPCDPSGGPNPEAEAYAESISGTIDQTLNGLIESLTTETQGELDNLNCDAIRTNMESLLSNLGFDRTYIFGADDKYFAQDMHKEFDSKPQSPVLNANRNADVVSLEEKHIELFDCDKNSYKFNALLTALREMANDDGLAEEILERISNWSTYQYNEYADDPDKFEEWLLRQLGDIMWEGSDLTDDYAQAKKESPKGRVNPEDFYDPIFTDFGAYNAIASTSNEYIDFSSDFTLDQASFYFLQGYQNINGVDRAFYLEELSRQQGLKSSAFTTTTTDFSPDNLLPLTLEKTVGNKTYTIFLDGIELTPNGAILDAYFILTDPETGQRVVFRAIDVGFGPTGIIGNSRLQLENDVEFRLNNAALLVLKGSGNTYVEWDCEGFSSMGIDVEIEFCRELIVPLDPATLEPIPEPQNYRLSFALQGVSSWLEFYMEVDAPPFALAKYPDVKWELTNMILDFSSTETPRFTPLEGYESPFWNGSTMSPLWRGFYMENLSCTLPKAFSSGEEPITASAFDILIDGSGFTGGVAVQNILSMDDGNMSGWPISVEDFELRVIKNQFAGAGIGGQINVPVFEENMEYEAVMYPGNEINFSISPLENATMNLFLADAEIYSNSEISVGKVGDDFIAVATLNGKISVNTGSGEGSAVNIGVPDIAFQGFQVSNQEPYFSPGDWGLEGDASVEVNFGGFGLLISGINPYNPGEGKAGLGFNIDINLVEALDLSAAGSFGVEGALEVNDNGQQSWVFERVIVNTIAIDASFPGAEIKGLLQWYGNGEVPDPDWGKGFRGLLDAKFKGFEAQIKAATQFGKKDGYKYFFVDALAELESGVGGALQIKGFGGGISYHMDVVPSTAIIPAGGNSSLIPPLGQSFSGTQYIPDESKGLGLKATVVLATAKEEVFNGTVSLQFLFNDSNGLDKISLTGQGKFLTGIDLGISPDFIPGSTNAPDLDAAITAYIDLTMNFEEPSFHGSLNVFLNGGPMLKGAGPGGKMVDAELHFDASQWYIYIGRPEEGQRCGVIIDIPGVGGVDATAYLDVGTNVPPMPALPQKVSEIAYLVNTNSSLRSSGAGFVFGASLTFDMSAKIAGIVTASLEAGAGFDMMLRKYEGLSCQGSSEDVGINGWYASGQMWAYVEGELQVFGINIISAGLAAVLQARLPNPTWAQATVGVRVKILFKTVTKSLKLELGEDCQLVTNDPNDQLGMEVITFLEPGNDMTDIPTNTKMRASFALELDKNYEMPDINGNEQAFRVELVSAELESDLGYSIPHVMEYINDKTAIELVPITMLPSADTITFRVVVNVFKNGQFLMEEEKSVRFVTDDPLTYIPLDNVEASYPADGMMNYYKNEYNRHKGYVQLKVGQPVLLLEIPAGKEQKVRFTSSSGNVQYVDYDYDVYEKEISFDMLPFDFDNGEVYKMEIVRQDLGSTLSDLDDGSTGYLEGAMQGAGRSSQIPDPSDVDENDEGIEEDPILLSMYFRVSDFNTFNDKLDAITATDYDVNSMSYTLSDIENFDELELNGTRGMNALVTSRADLSNGWHVDQLLPVLAGVRWYICDYQDYELDVNDLVYAAGVTGFSSSFVVGENDFNSGNMNIIGRNQTLAYRLEYESGRMMYDLRALAQECHSSSFHDVLEECASTITVRTTDECNDYENYMNAVFAAVPRMPSGTYRVSMKYQLPGGPVTTIRNVEFIK